MNLDEILERLHAGEMMPDEARRMITLTGIREVGDIAKLDAGRQNRHGIPEIILAESKKQSDVKKIVKAAMSESERVIISRTNDVEDVRAYALSLGYEVKTGTNCTTVTVQKRCPRGTGGVVGILAAGTSDVPVAEEARLVAEAMGCACHTEYDVGVAGIHRTVPAIKGMVEKKADVLVVAAGREGALATVVSGLCDVPVVGVPVSVGYGHGGNGEAALSAMLQSCALGMTVVNIDAGVAAGAAAANMANRFARMRRGGAQYL